MNRPFARVPVSLLEPHPLLEHWLPPLDPDEYSALVEDIRRNGVLSPISALTENGHYIVLDGHHRTRAAREVGLKTIPAHVIDGLSEDEQLERGLGANTSRRHLTRAEKRGIVRRLLYRTPQRSDRELARLAGVSHPTVAAVRRRLERDGALERFTNRLTADGRAYPTDRKEAGPGDRNEKDPVQDLLALIAEGRQFGTIYADPPWEYENTSSRGAAEDHYPTMSLDQLAALPIRELAATESHLHLWTTNAHLNHALQLLDTWGFSYKGMYVWVKPRLGTGNWWRVAHELLLLGVRGGARFRDRSKRSWGEFPRTRHSEKPAEVAKLIETVSPEPRIELFARELRPGWTVWGDEVRTVRCHQE